MKLSDPLPVLADSAPAEARSGRADADLEGIDVDVLSDGKVHLRASRRPRETLQDCAARIEALVEALGLRLDQVVTDVA